MDTKLDLSFYKEETANKNVDRVQKKLTASNLNMNNIHTMMTRKEYTALWSDVKCKGIVSCVQMFVQYLSFSFILK